MGTPAFAVPALQALIDNGYTIQSVFTQPDRPAARGQKLRPSPVKVLSQSHGIPLFQPERISSEENRAILENAGIDVIVVVAFGQLLPEWVLRAARLGAVNVHASLLPRYRGAAPIARAVLNGETTTGITTMLMEKSLDSGPILLQEEVRIPISMTTGELEDHLSVVGAKVLLRTLDGLKTDSLTPRMQDESKVSWAPRMTKEMAAISWEKCSMDIHNQIRAMNPWPGAHASLWGERIYFWQSAPVKEVPNSGRIPGTYLGLSEEGLRIQCGGGTILDILQVQRPSKKRISGREFAGGARLCAGEHIFN